MMYVAFRWLAILVVESKLERARFFGKDDAAYRYRLVFIQHSSAFLTIDVPVLTTFSIVETVPNLWIYIFLLFVARLLQGYLAARRFASIDFDMEAASREFRLEIPAILILAAALLNALVEN
jgi:hypothetical protein